MEIVDGQRVPNESNVDSSFECLRAHMSTHVASKQHSSNFHLDNTFLRPRSTIAKNSSPEHLSRWPVNMWRR